MLVYWYSCHAATRHALAAYLSQHGHTVHCAETPEIPLAGEDAVLLHLPGVIDEALVLVREFRRRAGDHVPLVTVGPEDLVDAVETILHAGADDFLGYPCAPECVALRLRVAEHLSHKYSVSAGQRRLEERLAQTSKNESIVTLAGSLAHDFNNLLTAIRGNAELAMIDVSPNSPVRYSLEQIDKTSRRAAELARQMLTFSGHGPHGSQFVAVNLNELVQEMAELLRISIPKSCVIRYYFTRPLPLIWGDPSQLRQVVMNLLLNAAESLEGREGTLFVRTGAPGEDHDAGRVTLEVRDTGTGMTPEVLARIFDPFFTTKRTGRGLGLAAIRGIVKAHKSSIEVESEPGKGSTFRIVFPAFDGAPATASHPRTSEINWHGTGTVLLIEDEEALRDATCRLLSRAGYTVLDARSGREGLDLIRRFGGVIHAAIVDNDLPGVDGVEVHQAISNLNPSIRRLIWCGFDPDGTRERIKAASMGVEVIEKPSQAHELALALKRLLAPQDLGQQRTA